MSSQIHVEADAAALAQRVAQDFATLAASASATKPFCVALSGGSTPKLLFSLLAQHYQDSIPWAHVHLFWVDERCVPATHRSSNYAMTKAALLDHVPLKAENIHRMAGELPPAEAAAQYEQMLQHFFKCAQDEAPSFHLMLLGMGTDGHVASLFPGNVALREQDRLVVAVEEPSAQPPQRLSLTMPVLIAARRTWFLVAGADKQKLLRSVLGNAAHVANKYPAARAHISVREPVWYIDQAAQGG